MQRGAGLLSKKILAALLSGGMLLLPNWGYAMPQGGTVVAGNITSGPLSPSGNQMDITGSGNVAINWNSFDIAQNETVNFQNMQAVLNYVSGGSRSEIYGNLKSGAGVHVFLVNPSGILFGKTAQVNVGQLTASTRRLEAGELTGFNGSLAPLTAEKAAKVQADIINLGKLTAGKLVLEGNNLSIIGADSIDVADKNQITLRANENINIGYEVTDKTTIDVGDGAGNTHQVSDYTKGGGTKASSVLSGASVTDLTGGSKSINDAMLVHDVYELQAINKNVAGNYMLSADIDASDTQGQNDNYWFKPLGNLTVANTGVLSGGFTGIFDGAGHSIENLYVKRPSEKRIGLFDYIAQGGVVGNFNIGGHIEGESNFGSVAGYNQGTIYSVVNSAELVSKGAGIGGIVGTNGGLIRDTVNTGTLNIDGSSGGIAGSNGDTNNAGTLVNVKNTGDVLSKITGGIGGIVGTNSANGTIKKAENTGAVKTLDNAGGELGGISGRNYGAIETATNTGNIAGHLYDDNKTGATKIGGIVGQNYADATVKAAENFGTVSGYYDVGGIAGVNAGTLESVQNHKDAAITAKLEAAGGISGTNSGTITKGSNSAAVKANNLYVGGIVGDNKNGGKIDDVVNEGTVDGKGIIGGIVGNNENSEIKNSANFGTVNAGDGNNNNGQSLAGGIAGYNSRNGSILSSYNQGNIHGNIAFVGGIAGQSISTIKDCYNVGNVSGNQYVGGIAGYTTGLNSNVYNLGLVSGSKSFGEIVGLNGSGTITNAYFATDTGFQKYGDSSSGNITVEKFNEDFLNAMDKSDKDLWLTYGDHATPLLKGLLKPLDINVGDIEAEYTDSGYTGLAKAIADKLAEQGIIIDVDKLLAGSKTEIGEYDLSDLLYSTQDGYALNVTGKLIIKAKAVDPVLPDKPVTPLADAKYTGSLTHLKTEKMQQEEYRNLDKRRNNLPDYAAVVVDGDGIKLEETEE
ncbi:filamentous hemagglutinin N-terminal domain-containing protein [Phascolarctobacterium sp.]